MPLVQKKGNKSNTGCVSSTCQQRNSLLLSCGMFFSRQHVCEDAKYHPDRALLHHYLRFGSFRLVVERDKHRAQYLLCLTVKHSSLLYVSVCQRF